MINVTTRRRRPLGDTGTNLYRVEPGDTLSLITWRYGRPGADVVVLWSVNSGQIGQNPDNLKVGWTLALPDGWPTSPKRRDRPTKTWLREAAAALAEVGVKYSPPPAQRDPIPPPLVPPEEIREKEKELAPKPSKPAWLSYLRQRNVQIGLGVAVLLGAGLWWQSTRAP
ncbi:MAG: LysM peptidoglycan-binding domain-containing protein [Dehalococcoidia bacterium]|nr:LysM peptidoglycan-binding domain-containing protein [Dehalococcoidia bacterium]